MFVTPLFQLMSDKQASDLFFTAGAPIQIKINGVVAPAMLVLVMLITGRRDIMGSRTNGPLVALLGWATTLFMCVLTLAWLWTRL